MASDKPSWACLLLIFMGVLSVSFSSEQGVWKKKLNVTKAKSYVSVYKTLYNQSEISLSVTCDSEKPVNVQLGWILRWSPCAEEYLDIGEEQVFARDFPRQEGYYLRPENGQIVGFNYEIVEYIRQEELSFKCDNTLNKLHFDPFNHLTLSPMNYAKQDEKSAAKKPDGKAPAEKPVETAPAKKPVETAPAKNPVETAPAKTPVETAPAKKPVETAPAKTPVETAPAKKPVETAPAKKPVETAPAKGPEDVSRRKREESRPSIEEKNTIPKGQSKKATPPPHPDNTPSKDLLTKTWKDGVFIFVIEVRTLGGQVDVEAEFSMKNTHGYLSAMEWPLLVFFGVMCIVYVALGLIWLVLLACNWRDLLRVQFWIGGVIVLGMLEKAVFYAEFQSINNTGVSVPGAVIFAELVSCLKRTVARMLVIIVSLGFGIIKPRLGPALHKVLGCGSLYFIFATVEACYRSVQAKSDQSSRMLMVAVPLALIDAIICWWIFTSLVETLRTLRLRRNIVKLSLYRHFTNTLVFAVLASMAFMVWSYTQHRLKICLTEWTELWVDDAYWHLLFSVILVVIMVLWRPTVNNQRYAFSPLLDAADDEADEDVIMSDAFHGMKMRGVRNGSPRQSPSSKADDDLKWVEENIPSSIIDKAIVDSEEEILTTKLEMSKME